MIGPAILPPGMLPLGAELLTVDAHEVERGDRLVGLNTPVDHVLFHGGDGRWLYIDHRGTIMAARRMGARVQVLRGGLSTHDCNPVGIERPRHLQAVR